MFEAAFYTPPELKASHYGQKDIPLLMELTYNRSVSRMQLIENANTILKDINGDKYIEAFKDELTQINQKYFDVKKGDRYTLCYVPTKGMSLYFNNKLQLTIYNDSFSRHYFNIWLGGHPITKQLSKNLLIDQVR